MDLIHSSAPETPLLPNLLNDMPEIIPKLNPDQIKNPGERDVYEALIANAPPDWFIRYHYLYTWREGKFLRDGEIDFVILIPKIGLLVLEVKSSHGYDCIDGQWCRVDKHLNREKTDNPFDQAMGNKHRLVEQLSKSVYRIAKKDFPGNYGYCVVYPRGKFEGGLPDCCDPSLLITNKDMPRLVKRLIGILSAGGAAKEKDGFSGEIFTQAKDYLRDQVKLVPVIAPDVSDDEKTISALTLNQYNALSGLLDDRRLHIKGGAGSGKTLLAKWSAEHKASQSKRVLLTCFNRNLAGWLRKECASSPTIEASSFFALARGIIIRAGIPFRVPTDRQKLDIFWKEKVPVMLCDALDQTGSQATDRYDCVIVDEAQDFAPNWWLPLQLLLKDPDNGLIQIFSDEDQRGVYGADDCIPSGLIEMPLKENCRNTQCITEFSGKLIERDAHAFTLAPNGESPFIHEPVLEAHSRAATVKSIYNSLCEQGLQTSQIAILSPYSAKSEMSSLHYLGKIRNLPLAGDDKGLQIWQDGKAVWTSTIKAFKGLEADCIIITDIGKRCMDSSWRSELYVGCTRAKHRLHIVTEDRETLSSLKNNY